MQHCCGMRVNLLYYIVSMQVPLLTPQIHRCLCVAAKTLDAPSVHCTLQLHEAAREKEFPIVRYYFVVYYTSHRIQHFLKKKFLSRAMEKTEGSTVYLGHCWFFIFGKWADKNYQRLLTALFPRIWDANTVKGPKLWSCSDRLMD